MANDVSKAYDAAIATYQNYLPALQTKYNGLLTQLQSEQNTSVGLQNQLFGSEKTNLTNEIAKRGLTAMSGDTFFDTQQTALGGNQQVRGADLLNKFASERLGINNARTGEELDVRSAIAGLQRDKASELDAIKRWKKEYKLSKKKFEYEKKSGKDSLALEYYKANKSGSGSDKDYNSQILSDISAAVSGTGNYAPYLREMIANTYKGKLPQKTIDEYISTYMPAGWEDSAKRARQ